MPSELEMATNILTETEQEWRRVAAELKALTAERSGVLRQIKAAGKYADPNLLVDLLDQTRQLDEKIKHLEGEKSQCESQRKLAKEQAKEVEKKAEQLRKMISAIDDQLAPGGELVRKIREAQHAVELHIRLREAAERERVGLVRQLQDLIGLQG